MNFCHFVTKHLCTLCKLETGEDTINIHTANINGTFFYPKTLFFQTKCPKVQFTFCQQQKRLTKALLWQPFVI